MNEIFLEALKIEYSELFPGKVASFSRVHFSKWVFDKLCDVANEMDDDAFFDYQHDYIDNASPVLKEQLAKYFED